MRLLAWKKGIDDILASGTITPKPLGMPVVCAASVRVGDFVYVVDSTQLIQIVNHSNPLNRTTVPAVGVITDKESDTAATMMYLNGVIDVYQNLVVGRGCFIGLDGNVTQSSPMPTVKDQHVYIQYVGVAITSTSILLESRTDIKVLTG